MCLATYNGIEGKKIRKKGKKNRFSLDVRVADTKLMKIGTFLETVLCVRCTELDSSGWE